MNCVNFTSVRPHLARPQAARLVQSLRDHFWPGLRVVVGRQGRGKTDLLRQAYLLQCNDLAGPIPVWLRPGAGSEGEQLVTQLIEFRAGRLHSPFATLDPALLCAQRDQTLLQQVVESSGHNSPERFFDAVGRWLNGEAGGGKDIHLCLYVDDASEAWLSVAVGLFGLPIAVVASAPAADSVPRAAQLIRLEELSTREAVLLGEKVAREAGLAYRGEAAEGFCAHLDRNPHAIAAAVLAASHAGRPLQAEADFAEALLDAGASTPQSTERALQHATLLAGFAQARRREEQARVNARISEGLARITPACETWLAEQGVSTARIPVVTSVASEDLPGGTLHLAFGSGVFGGQELLAVALLESGAGKYAASLAHFRTRVATLAPPPATLFDPRWEHLELWAVFQKPPADAAALAESVGARLVAWDVFERLVVGQALQETFPDTPETVLRLPLDKDFEIPAVYALDHLLERRGVDKRSAAQIRMGLVEACLNAIEHGRATSAEDAFMEVRLQVGRDQARLTVTNPGLPKSELGASLLRGHGRKILHSLMDSVRYESDLNRTRVILTKRISGPAAEADHEQASTGGQRS